MHRPVTYPITHRQVLARGPSSLCGQMVPALVDCDGQLQRRLFKPNSSYLVCGKCGARLDLDLYWQVGKVFIQTDHLGRSLTVGRGVIQEQATDAGPTSQSANEFTATKA